MRSHTRFAFLFIALAMVSLTLLASAQTVSSGGSGTYRVNGKSRPVSKAVVRFVNDDRFICTLTINDGKTVELRGRYTGHGHHRDIRVYRDSKNTDVMGYGELELSNNNGDLRSITAHGEGDGDSFALKFTADRGSAGGGGDPDKDDRHSFSDSVIGTGLYQVTDHQKRLTHMRIEMNRNGDLHLHGEGPDLNDTSWEGRWSGSGPDYTIDIRHSGNYSVHATGTLTLSKNHKAFKQLSVDGKLDGRAFQLRFNAE